MAEICVCKCFLVFGQILRLVDVGRFYKDVILSNNTHDCFTQDV